MYFLHVVTATVSRHLRAEQSSQALAYGAVPFFQHHFLAIWKDESFQVIILPLIVATKKILQKKEKEKL